MQTQRWETKFIIAQQFTNVWRVRYEDGVENKRWGFGRNMYRRVETLGKQGWELISSQVVIRTNGIEWFLLVFKRQKRGTTKKKATHFFKEKKK